MTAVSEWGISGVELAFAFIGEFISAVVPSCEAQTFRSETAHRAQPYRYAGKLHTLMNFLTDAETGQRGYLLTGRTLFC